MSGIEIIISWSGGDRSLLIWLDWWEIKVSLRDRMCYRWCFDWQWTYGSAKYHWHWQWVKNAYTTQEETQETEVGEDIPF